MIRNLLDESRRFGEPEYSAAGKIVEAKAAALRQRLGKEEAGWLEEMEDAYARREGAVMAEAFRSGFCQAALLGLDVLEYHIALKGAEKREDGDHG